MSELPLVTVLIPARNEEGDIERCLRAVLAQDYPHDRMEIVLVDGCSQDRTVEIAKSVLAAADVDWRILDNPVGTTPSNLNVGLAVARGDYVCRVDARSLVPMKYVRLCAETLSERPEVSVTGGAQAAVPGRCSALSIGIARALNNPIAMGGSRYRGRASSGPSDTVYLGAFRTAELRRAGGWDERFSTNQDFELNRRLGRNGVVWFDDRVNVQYIPRQRLSDLARQYFRFGRWKVRYWRAVEPPQRRQVVLLAAAASAVMVGVGAVVLPGRRMRRAAVVVALGAATLIRVERVGGDSEVGLGVRTSSVAAMATTTTSWVLGVVYEAMRLGSRTFRPPG